MSVEVEVLVQNFLQKKFPNIDADLLNYVVGKILYDQATNICFKSISCNKRSANGNCESKVLANEPLLPFF